MRKKLILASNSPRRRELLKTLGVDFESRSPEVAEKDSGDDLVEVIVANAVAKALSVSLEEPEALVLGADTAIIFNDHLIGKPADSAAARRMLTDFSGKTHLVVTGIALAANGKIVENFFEKSAVKFKTLAPDDITRYMEKVSVLDKAGAYAIQEHGDIIIDSCSGSVENVIGLPLDKLPELLEKYLD